MHGLEWGLWHEFCAATGREPLWGRLIGEELARRKILPAALVADIGCGSGAFTAALTAFTPNVVGVDTHDPKEHWTGAPFAFKQADFQNWTPNPHPGVMIFKQSFHLIAKTVQGGPEIIPWRFTRTTLVIIQMPEPFWSQAPEWKRAPLNAEANAELLRRNGRETEVIRLQQTHPIQRELLERMFLEGYTPDLRGLNAKQRAGVWAMAKTRFGCGPAIAFPDPLDVIIAHPAEYPERARKKTGQTGKTPEPRSLSSSMALPATLKRAKIPPRHTQKPQRRPA